jgi:shikimate kinase
MSLWLVGIMGSGKTTVGERTAVTLGVPFHDTDHMVEEMTGMTVAEIWEDGSEMGFRELERRVVATVPESGVVAAAGGGAVLDPTNREHMRRSGPVVWLRCDPALAAERVGQGATRPLLDGDVPMPERLAAILEKRTQAYSGLATDVVDTDNRSVTEVVSEVVEIWQG